MAITIRNKAFGIYYWGLDDENLVLPNVCNNPTKFLLLDPQIIDDLEGDKNTTFSQSDINTSLSIETSDDLSFIATHYANTTWEDNGWTLGNSQTFKNELETFVQNNYGQQSVNINFFDVVILMSKGKIGGVDYTIPVCFFGNIGDEDQAPGILKLLMHFNGNVNDYSDFNLTPTTVGSLEGFDTGKFGQAIVGGGAGCVNFDIDHFDFGDKDFTIDFWAKSNMDGGYRQIINNYSGGGWDLQFHGTDFGAWFPTVEGGGPVDGGYHIVADVSAKNDGEWHHYAVVRGGGELIVFVDGVDHGRLAMSGTLPVAPVPLTVLGLGGGPAGGEAFQGQLDELRVIVGEAVWTSDFTPPTGPYNPPLMAEDIILLMHFDGDETDSSSFERTSTTYDMAYDMSGKFSQSGDFTDVDAAIEFTNNSDFSFGTLPWTVDFWAKFGNSVQYFISFGGYSDGWAIATHGQNVVITGASIVSPNVTGINDGNFHHIAVVRDTVAQQIKFFVDGKLIHSASLSNASVWRNNTPTSIPVAIGARTGKLQPLPTFENFQGFMDELRIIKGRCMWTQDFVPPTAPYVGNEEVMPNQHVSALLHFDNDLLDSSPYQHPVTNQGSITFGSGPISNNSAVFSSNVNDKIYYTGNLQAFKLRNLNFTIDFWIKGTPGSVQYILNCWSDAIGEWAIVQNATAFRMQFQGGGTYDVTASTILDGNWNHVAYVRNGNSMVLYKNGVNAGSFNVTGQNVPDNGLPLSVGGIYDTTDNKFTGELSEIRIQKNIVAWTSNFTPPSAPYTL